MPPIKKQNRAYKKGEAYKDFRKFVIICEGQREASYFNFFHDKYKKLVVEILEPTDEFHGNSAPGKLAKRAGLYIENEQWDHTLGDELWFVVDTDKWKNKLHGLSDLCSSTKNWFLANRGLLKTHFENLKGRFFSDTRQQKRSLAALNEYFANEVSGKKIASKLKQGFLEVPYSNPCFEVWLYYHFDCVRVTEGNSQAMKQILNSQRAGGYKPHDYIVHIERALQSASEMDKFPKQSIADVGITKVYQLCIKILELLPKTGGRINFGVQP